MNRPFDEAKYKRLLDGLEFSVLRYSEVNQENSHFRIESEYFAKKYIAADLTIRSGKFSRIADIATVTDGEHGSPKLDDLSGIIYLSGQNVKDNFLDLNDIRYCSKELHNKNLRSTLTVGSVLLSIVGTVGNATVIYQDILGNTDRNVATIKEISPHYSPYFLSTFLNCRFGKYQTERASTGNVQPLLNLIQVKSILVPILSNSFQFHIESFVKSAHQKREQSKTLYAEAENLLLDELGLHDWQPSEEQIAVKSFKESFLATGRFDAEYYQPKYQTLMALLGRSDQQIGEVADLAKDRFDPARSDSFEYIEIGSLSGDGSTESETLLAAEAPSRAQWIVRAGDVITSTVRPIRRLSALIENQQSGFVCSSGFAVLRPTNIAAELLLVYLRAPIICEILDLHTTASMYPAISTDDLLAIPIPAFSDELTNAVTRKIRESRIAKQESKCLLDLAKRGVEMAIEEDEATAMQWMEAQTHN